MLRVTGQLLRRARAERYAIDTFNILNFAGAMTVVQPTESLQRPAIIQVPPSTVEMGGRSLIAMCQAIAEVTEAEAAAHHDHCTSPKNLALGMIWGCPAVMADGLALPYGENVSFARAIVELAHRTGQGVKTELARLNGEEDAVFIAMSQVTLIYTGFPAAFVARTGHAPGGHHRRRPRPRPIPAPARFRKTCRHRRPGSDAAGPEGTSVLPEAVFDEAINHGFRKCTVNTEVKSAYLQGLSYYLRQAGDRE